MKYTPIAIVLLIPFAMLFLYDLEPESRAVGFALTGAFSVIIFVNLYLKNRALKKRAERPRQRYLQNMRASREYKEYLNGTTRAEKQDIWLTKLEERRKKLGSRNNKED